MEVLVVDVGGTSVKLWHTEHEEHRKFESGKLLEPGTMVSRALELTADWNVEGIALGLPTRVNGGRPVEDPQNLGPGWVGFNFGAAFDKPVRIMNDATLQALGSYDGGRMLFLGLGTAVGSALIVERKIITLDLGRFRYGDERISDLLGDDGFEELGEVKWQKAVTRIVSMLKAAMMADYVVLGGGSVKKLEELPDGARRGHNRTVVEGGRRLWHELPDPAEQKTGEWWIL